MKPLKNRFTSLALTAGITMRIALAAAGFIQIASAGQFSYRTWTNDGDCGVSPLFTYTCAVNLNGIPTCTVNGVMFTGQSSMPGSGPGYAISGFSGSYNAADDANTVGGQSRELAKRFRYDGKPGLITLTGLTPGVAYRATLFSVGWDADGRTIIFSCGSDSATIDQDIYGNNAGIRIDYDYVAGASGTVTISATPTSDFNPQRSFHLYAFCNCEKRQGLYVDNRSFEYPVIVGNAGLWEYQASIGGWTQSGGPYIGLTTNAQPWAGDAAFPGGAQACFIQNSSSNTATLAQQLVNLTSGETYRVSYRYAARVGASGQTTPIIKVSVDGNVLQETHYLKNLGAGNPFFLGAHEFTATGTTATLKFENVRLGAGLDSAVLLDDVAIEPAGADGWTLYRWTGDATAGIVSNAYYSHAINLADTASPAINGVVFKGSGTGANPAEGPAGANYSSTLGSVYTANDANALTTNAGGSAALALHFCYHTANAGALQGFTLNGLLPGQAYETTLYGVGWDAMPGSRNLAFSVNGSAEVTFDENLYDNNSGVRLTHRGAADTNGAIAVAARLLYNTFSFHLYGFANRAQLGDEIVLADAFSGHNGADNGANISARGPDHRNAFLSGNYVETGMNAAYHATVQGGVAQFGANAGAAIRIHNRDGRLKPSVLRLQADLKIGTLTGTDYVHARGVGLGFFALGVYTSSVEVATGFTGLVLAPSGDLYLVQNGDYAGDASRVPYGGTFTNSDFYTLSYEVNVDSGTITNLTLEGSASDYSAVVAAANGFSKNPTAMLGLLGSSAAPSQYGYMDNLIVTELAPGVPPPFGTLILVY